MLTAYLICLLSGGALVTVSVLFGGDADSDLEAEADFEASLDLDADADLDVDLDADLDGDLDAGHDLVIHADATSGDVAAEIWLPFFSLRFWTFATAFFGLTGTLLTLLSGIGWILTAGVSAGMGVFAGSGMAYLLHYFQKKELDSTINPREYIGRTADVIVPIDAEHPGKIRLNIHETQIDLIATSDDSFKRGDTAFVIAVNLKDGVARVVKRFKELQRNSKES